MNKNLIAILLFLLLSFSAFAQGSKSHLFYEKEYQTVWCERNCGQTEVILPDKTRVDCVTKTHAIEFDFASKWAESIGQSLYYAAILNKTPGIVLIVEDDVKEEKYVKRAQLIARKYCINLWVMRPSEIKN